MSPQTLVRPNTNNYFQFYGLEERFDIDLKDLKNRYLDKSRQYHPDFFGHDPQSQNIAVATSSYNNIAFKTLDNEIRRAQYLIELKLDEEAEYQALPQSFLMEMMDMNEAIDELTDGTKSKLENDLKELKMETLKSIRNNALSEQWHDCQIEVLKWKYLERLENRILPEFT